METRGLDSIAVAALRCVLAEAEPPAPDTAPGPLVGLGPQTLEVFVAGLPQHVRLEPRELIDGYVILMRILLDAQLSTGRRIVAGIAGVPGSGKSTVLAVLAELWRYLQPGPGLAVMGMDGWHLTNSELDRRTFTMPDGTTIPLGRRKGSPPSFDAESLARTLYRIRYTDQDIPFPVYDRNLHEPVPNAGGVSRQAKIVLIEGNYLLLDEGDWGPVTREIDLPMWLDIDPAVCRRGLIARHVAGGMPQDQAVAKYTENDRPNTDIALTGRPRAKWILRADRSHRLVDVRPRQLHDDP